MKRSRLVLIAASALSLTCLASFLPTSATAAPSLADSDDFSSSSTHQSYYQQKLMWSKQTCPNFDAEAKRGYDTDVECATVLTPLDWYNPAKGTIELRISRKVGTSGEGKRLLLSNPGGPGNPALVLGATQFVRDLGTSATHYAVGMDPRGVGASTPLLCSTSVDVEADHWSDGDLRTFTRDEVSATARNQKALFEACQKLPEVARLAPYINSDQTARDVNLVRAVLGYAQADFYGVSYGSWLGSIIARHFPNKFDRVMLEGNIDWTNINWELIDQQQMMGFQASYDHIVVPFIARHDDVYHLGKIPTQVEISLDYARSRLAAEGRAYEFDNIVAGALTRVDAPHRIALKAQEILSQPAAAPKPAAAAVEAPAKDTVHIDTDLAFNAIACGDVVNGQDADAWFRARQGQIKNLPVRGGAYVVPTCYGWKATSALSKELLQRPVKQVLMVQQEGDPATGYLGAYSARRNAKGDVKMVFVDDLGGHAHIHDVSRCAASAMDAYMLRGMFPTSDVACQAGPQSVKLNPDKTPVDVTDKAIFEFMNASTKTKPLPDPGFYYLRSTSVDRVDSTPEGLIAGSFPATGDAKAQRLRVNNVDLDTYHVLRQPAWVKPAR